jgi:hypothetical protein
MKWNYNLQITEEERIPRVFVKYQSKGKSYHGLQRQNWITGKSEDVDLTKEERKGEVDDSDDDDDGDGEILVVYTCA